MVFITSKKLSTDYPLIIASVAFATSAVTLTSCTLTIFAPFYYASGNKCPSALILFSGVASSILPIKDFLEGPRSIGTPSLLKFTQPLY